MKGLRLRCLLLAGSVWGLPAQQLPLTNIPGQLAEISAGADGSVWGINQGQDIFRWDSAKTQWVQVPGKAAKIAGGGPDGLAWVVTAPGNQGWGQIYRWNKTSNNWDSIPGAALSVGAGKDGSVYVVGNGIYKYAGSGWTLVGDRYAIDAPAEVAVDAQGTPWVLNNAGRVYRFTGSPAKWTALEDTTAMRSLGIGAGKIWGVGKAQNLDFASTTANVMSLGRIAPFDTYIWDGTKWGKTNYTAHRVAPSEPKGTPWFVQSDGSIFRDDKGVITLASLGVNFCWKAHYGRGGGTIPSNCPDGYEKGGALCYPKCAAGMTGVGPVCWSTCPAGFTDIGVSCSKPAATSSAGYAWQFGDAAFSLDGARARCAAENKYGCYTSGALVFPNCPPNFHKVGDNVCTPDCPAGLRDDGAFCAKASAGRGAGVVGVCGAGLQLDAGGLCYPACGNQFDGIGPMCWAQCGGGAPVACGAGCAFNDASCGKAVAEMTLNTVGAAASILSFVAGGPGLVDAAKTAASAGKKAAQISTSYAFRKGLEVTLEVGKTFMKQMLIYKLTNPRNIFFTTVGLINTGTLKGLNEAAQHFGVMKEEKLFDYTAFAALDLTGISSAVLAYTQYGTCNNVEDFIPATRSLDLGAIPASGTTQTIAVKVYRDTTFTKIGAPAYTNGCSIKPTSDCVGKTIRAGGSCSITVNAAAGTGLSLEGELRLYTSELHTIPYPIEIKANTNGTAECQTDTTVDDPINAAHLNGAWALNGDFKKRLTIDKDGKIDTFEGVSFPSASVPGKWGTGWASVSDAKARKVQVNLNGSYTLTLSALGDKMTDGTTTLTRLPWHERCPEGFGLYLGMCVGIPVGNEMTMPGFYGLPCPLGWRDDGTSCWPPWTGPGIPAQADKDSTDAKMRYPILVTDARFGTEACPNNWTKGGITCTPAIMDKKVKGFNLDTNPEARSIAPKLINGQ